MTIQFNRSRDLDFLYDDLSKRLLKGMTIAKKKKQIDVHIPVYKKKEGLAVLKESLLRLFFERKRLELWKTILKEDFFYQDEHEQNEIIQIAQSILEGKRKDLPVNMEEWRDVQQIERELQDVLKNNPHFSFDAFITFRLRFYLEKMGQLIEVAIDEYKLEQDYQMYLQYLRDFLSGREPQMECLYVVDQDGFIFFDEDRNEIQQADLYQRIDRRLLFSHPVYVDSLTIAPLISIAPKQIFLFTNQSDSGIIQTLKNIFEEKITIQPLDYFEKQWEQK